MLPREQGPERTYHAYQNNSHTVYTHTQHIQGYLYHASSIPGVALAQSSCAGESKSALDALNFGKCNAKQ